MNSHKKNIHFMGVGGIGVSALAGICLSRGYHVSGCDRELNMQTALVESLGGEVAVGHDPAHLQGIDEVVYTSAISRDEPELVAAGDKAIRRGCFLAKLMDGNRGVGICGTHGKTTTSWMLSHILIHCGLDPTVLLGGSVRALGGNFRVGGDLFVSELDESDGTFLEPQLHLALITNVESEHLAHYGSLDKVVQSFADFSDNSIGPDILVACLDDPVACELYHKRKGCKVGYGIENKDGYHAILGKSEYGTQNCTVYAGKKNLGDLNLPFPGKYNVLNALGALAAAMELGVDFAGASEALADCPPIGRRMEFIGNYNGTEMYSDYAHHPTEVTSAISGARELAGDGRLLVIFQPHLFTRTRDYCADFAKSFLQADGVILTDIYPAREEPIDGISARLISQKVDVSQMDFTGPVALEDINDLVLQKCAEYEVVVYMGAGSIDKMAREFIRSHVL